MATRIVTYKLLGAPCFLGGVILTRYCEQRCWLKSHTTTKFRKQVYTGGYTYRRTTAGDTMPNPALYFVHSLYAKARESTVHLGTVPGGGALCTVSCAYGRGTEVGSRARSPAFRCVLCGARYPTRLFIEDEWPQNINRENRKLPRTVHTHQLLRLWDRYGSLWLIFSTVTSNLSPRRAGPTLRGGFKIDRRIEPAFALQLPTQKPTRRGGRGPDREHAPLR